MNDESFGLYQEARAAAEKSLREAIFGWVVGDAPPDMTLGEVRDLTNKLVTLLNGATRRTYDIGLGARKAA